MLKGTFEFVNAKLHSFGDATDKTIVFKNESIIYKGVNSPYKSHQQISYSQGHGLHETLILTGHYNLVVASAPNYDFTREEWSNCSWEPFPSFRIIKHLRNYAIWVEDLPKWLTENQLIYILIKDSFVGYKWEMQFPYNRDENNYYKKEFGKRPVFQPDYFYIDNELKNVKEGSYDNTLKFEGAMLITKGHNDVFPVITDMGIEDLYSPEEKSYYLDKSYKGCFNWARLRCMIEKLTQCTKPLEFEGMCYGIQKYCLDATEGEWQLQVTDNPDCIANYPLEAIKLAPALRGIPHLS